jgi:hypothetical protein
MYTSYFRQNTLDRKCSLAQDQEGEFWFRANILQVATHPEGLATHGFVNVTHTTICHAKSKHAM